jgi:tetratricopeptide (TPR) repeat protein
MKGDLNGAAAAFEQAATVAPDNALALTALAEVQSAQGKPDRAIVTLARAQERSPNNLQVRLTRASVWTRSGSPAKALAEYDDALKTFGPPLSAALHLQKGALLQASAKSAEAEAAFRQAIEADPNAHLAYNNLAWLLAEGKRELDQALAAAQKALALAPGLAPYEDTMGFVRLTRQEVDEAIAAFGRASRAAPAVPDFEYRLATALEAKGQLAQALASYDKALAKAAAARGRPFAQLDEAKRRRAALVAKGIKP